MNTDFNPAAVGNLASSGGLLPQFIGFSSLFAALFSPRRADALKLVLLGALVESGRRACQWIWERFTFKYYVSAKFYRGDPTYEWISHSLARRELWRKCRNFNAFAEIQSKGATDRVQGPILGGHAQFAAVYDIPHLFRWNGSWLQIKKSPEQAGRELANIHYGGMPDQSYIELTAFSRDIRTLSAFVEDARADFVESHKSRVVIRSAEMRGSYATQNPWLHAKIKTGRPLSSLILDPGVVDSLLADMQEFLKMENWYVDAGIPHRRGYLLYGPPGTGKTSTLHAIAGELGLDIYVISLASNAHVLFIYELRGLLTIPFFSMDDQYLQEVVSRAPSRCMLLMEDIDCAFPPRDESEDRTVVPARSTRGTRRSAVTLSGLLNVIDGIGSEEGKMFFATTNHVDRLDPAFLRPGRVDVRIEYRLASKSQAHDLFARFFPESRFGNGLHVDAATDMFVSSSAFRLAQLAVEFSEAVPEHKLSTAELQGFLLGCKTDPVGAVTRVGEWAEQELAHKRSLEEREESKEERKRQVRLQKHQEVGEAMAVGLGRIMQRDLVDKTPRTETAAVADRSVPTSETTPNSNPEEPTVETDHTGSTTFPLENTVQLHI